MTISSRYVDECANYLIQFFYKTNKRYSCTRTKIGKLLSILAFKYAVKYDENIFSWEIYRYPGCGTLIAGLQCYVDRDVYFAYPYDNSKKRISRNELNENADIPDRYKDVSNLDPKLKEEIENVFFTFGAYSQSDLSDELNPIVEFNGICRHDGSIDLDAVANLDKNQFRGNKVVEYMFK